MRYLRSEAGLLVQFIRCLELKTTTVEGKSKERENSTLKTNEERIY